MQDYSIFEKRRHFYALPTSDITGSAFLQEWGYVRLSAVIRATDARAALSAHQEIFTRHVLRDRISTRWRRTLITFVESIFKPSQKSR